MNSLTLELLGYLAAAGLISLWCGWMIGASIYRHRLRTLSVGWQKALSEAQEQAREDTASLEEQLQDLGHELKMVNDDNRKLGEQLERVMRKQQASRSSTIEHNSQQTRSHERLQQLLHERENEISQLRWQLGDSDEFKSRAPDKRPAMTSDSITERSRPLATDQLQSLDAIESLETGQPFGQNNAPAKGTTFDSTPGQHGFGASFAVVDENVQTQVIGADELPTEMLDRTLRLDSLEQPNPDPLGMYVVTDDTEDSLDEDLDLSEATMAIDDGALPFRRTQTPKNRD